LFWSFILMSCASIFLLLSHSSVFLLPLSSHSTLFPYTTLFRSVLTMGTAMVLPSTVPFAFNMYFILIITVLIVLFALLGAFFSVRTVAKIDPLEAIG